MRFPASLVWLLGSNPSASSQVLPATLRIAYFAYGSNLDATILSRRVGSDVTLVRTPASLDGYRLAFSLPSVTFVPAFACVVSCQKSQVHGCIYELSIAQYARLCVSEGVPLAYIPTQVQVTPYQSTSTRVNTRSVVTLVGRVAESAPDRAPSMRYISILRRGARELSLNESYVQFLDSVKPRDEGVGSRRL